MKKACWTTARLGAMAIAAGLAGPVHAVDVSDPWITTKVKAALLTASDVDALDVNVDTVGGKVTLSGHATTAAEKARAEQLARAVDGVRDVRNLIQVAPDAQQKQAAATDDRVRDRVSEALKRDPALANVTVDSVSQGVVVLGGRTDTLSAHLHALEVARAQAGVQRVESQIQSPDKLADEEIWKTPDVAASPGRSAGATAKDLWITSAAKVRLLASDVPALDVNVDTRNGEVTLFGTVHTPDQKKLAADEVQKVEGVRAVHNELQVVPEARETAAARADDQIKSDVQSRLGDRFGRNIDVEVANGVVRLSGTVASQEQRLAALTTARSSEGVRSVVGDLRVERN